MSGSRKGVLEKEETATRPIRMCFAFVHFYSLLIQGRGRSYFYDILEHISIDVSRKSSYRAHSIIIYSRGRETSVYHPLERANIIETT